MVVEANLSKPVEFVQRVEGRIEKKIRPSIRLQHLFENETIPAPDKLHDDWETREALRRGECAGTKLINCSWGQDIYRALMASAPQEKRPRTGAVYQQMIKGYMRLVASLDENLGRLLD